MTEWSDLPVEMRHEVAKNLNIIDRASLKMCSKTDCRVINSLHKKVLIPLVILSIRENWASLIIYHGIKDFIKMKFEEKEISKKTLTLVTTRRSNRKLLTQQQSNMKPLEFAARTLEQLLMQKNIKIKTFSILFPGLFFEPEQTEKLFDKFRSYITSTRELRIGVICRREHWDMLLGMARIERENSVDWEWPLVSASEILPTEYPHMATYSVFLEYETWDVSSTSERDFEAAWCSLTEVSGIIEETFEETKRFCLTHNNPIDRDPNHLFDSIPGSFDVMSNGSKVKRCVSEDGKDYIYYNLSSCGLFVYRTPLKNEKIAERVMREKYGLGVICAKHADPFDYWYIKDFRNRRKDEDFWRQPEKKMGLRWIGSEDYDPVDPVAYSTGTLPERVVTFHYNPARASMDGNAGSDLDLQDEPLELVAIPHIERETPEVPEVPEVNDTIHDPVKMPIVPGNSPSDLSPSQWPRETLPDNIVIDDLPPKVVMDQEQMVESERVVDQKKSQKVSKKEQKEQKRQMKEESAQTEESKKVEKKSEKKEKKRGKFRSLLCCF